MNREEKKLKKHLAQHALGFAVLKQRQKASRVRKALLEAAPPRPRFQADGWEDSDEADLEFRERRPRPGHGARRQPSEERAPKRETQRGASAETRSGVVVGLVGGTLRVALDEGEASIALAGVRLDPIPAPGDDVRLEVTAQGARFVAMVPRRNALVRPDPHVASRPRVLAANVDMVVVVVPVAPCAPSVGLVDRVLLAAHGSGCRALACLSKIDLVSAAELERTLDRWGEVGVPVVACSSATGVGLERLDDLLRDRRAVLVGQSGAGKTSILNALVALSAPAVQWRGRELATAPVRARDGKGRHTTSAATLLRLPGGGEVLDTPGIRQFGMWSLERWSVHDHFPDIAVRAAQCRYRDCGHHTEPDCAVREAVATAQISMERYRRFMRLLGECTG